MRKQWLRFGGGTGWFRDRNRGPGPGPERKESWRSWLFDERHNRTRGAVICGCCCSPSSFFTVPASANLSIYSAGPVACPTKLRLGAGFASPRQRISGRSARLAARKHADKLLHKGTAVALQIVQKLAA